VGGHAIDHLIDNKRVAMREQIDQLATKFLARCTQDIASLHGLLARLRSGDTAALRELEYLAHRLSGTGALLGFGSIGTCAGVIERLAETHAENAAPDQQVMQRITEYTAKLEQEIDLLAQTRK
jgi:chemotaxis protein histidine kinase CheA